MIKLESVSLSYADTCVVDSLSLNIHSGELFVLHGPSGIGKTSLLELAAGVSAPNSGQVLHTGKTRAVAFQDDALVPWLSARDNLLFALSGRFSLQKRQQQADQTLTRFELPPNALPPEMSGGMRRRLNLARAFSAEADMLFLDEPFAFLNERWHTEIKNELAQCCARGGAAFVVTHELAPLLGTPATLAQISAAPVSPATLHIENDMP